MRLLVTGILVIFTAVTSVAEPMVLVDQGEAEATIVVPQDGTATVEFAAEELARYLEAIGGAKLPIAAEPDDIAGTAVHVGPTKAAQKLLPEQPEGIRIAVETGPAIICGGSDRGTLFAVYRFLEECLGCRWLAPDEEYVPKMETIAVEPMDLATAPIFDMRTFKARRDDRRAWGMKMGMNGFYKAEDVVESANGYYHSAKVPGCHAYHLIIPSEMYFDEHPEWFPLQGGERRPGQLHGSQLCVTAPGLADEFAKRVIEIFDEDPNLQMMSISPNDGRGWCECEDCQALDERLCGGRMTKQGLAGESPFRGDRVFWFANEVARRVAKVYPDKLLLVLAYINYAESPDTIVPEPNVVPWLCHFAPADYSRPINDPTSEPNAQFNDLLKQWADSAPHLLFYSYVSKSMWWRLPRPITHNFAADLKYLHSLGIRRYYCQSSLTDWPLDGPLYYVLAKLMWNPSADPEQIAADWISHMFGSAAEHMTEFYAAVEDAVEDSGQSFSDNPPRDVPGLFSMGDLDRAMGALDAAAAAAGDDGANATRVKRVGDVFRYGYHMVRCIEAADSLKTEPSRDSMRQAMREGEKALNYCRVREAARFLDSIRMNEKLGVMARGMGEAEELGGRRCWNTDETGPGDNRAGWATFWVQVEEPEKGVRIEMDVWGESDLHGIVVNTGGHGKSYAQGGIWKRVDPETPLSGEAQWDTLVFGVKPEVLAPGNKMQRVGMGGGDSQIWIAEVRVRQGQGK